MKVVFLEEVEGTAHTGDVKNVAGGFARNFLLPRKLAAPATPHYIEIATQKATKEARKQSKLDEDAQRLIPQVEGKEITIEVRVGDQDKMFGSVTARDVAEKLSQATKIDIEHRQIDLKQPIREIGHHNIKVKLTRNVIAGITVHVLPIGGAAEAAAKAEAAKAEPEAPADEEPSDEAAEEEADDIEAAAESEAESVEGE
jgi:large subunit ribosomal protein L9